MHCITILGLSTTLSRYYRRNPSDLKMDYEDETSSDERDAMEAVVNSLVGEIDENDENDDLELDDCVKDRVEECTLTKNFPCGLCTKVCKSKGGLTLHTRAKHGEKTATLKSISPMTSKVFGEIVDKAAQSVITSKLYGESMAELITQADLKPSERLVKELGKLYDNYCEKLDRDKLLKDFYKLMIESGKTFKTDSKNMHVPAYNLIMIQIPDLLVGFYKRGNVKEKLPDIKPIEKSELGPLTYVAGYVISKMYRESIALKETPEQLELRHCC